MPPRTAARTRQRTPAPVSESLQGLGERLRKARSEAGLSQAQLGAPHFTRAYISALELGKVRPAMSSLEFVAGKLGKPSSYFMEDAEEERRRTERDLDVKAAAVLLTRATASEALTRIRALLETATSPAEMCQLRLMAGTAENFMFRGAEALKELVIAERLSRQIGAVEIARATAHQTAIALRLMGEHVRARDMLAGLLSEAERAEPPDRIFRVRLLRDMGAVSWDLGEYERASAYYESALEWAQDIGDVAGLTAIYNGLGYARRALGDFEGAAAYLQKALGATQVANDLAMQAILHNALAVVAAERGHLQAAYRHVDRAIQIATVNGPESHVPHYLTTKAECALKTNSLADAREFAQNALGAAERTGNQRAAAAAKVVLGEVSARSNEALEGDRRLEEAVAIYRDLGAKRELADVLMRLSELARTRGDLNASQRYAQEAFRATHAKSGLIGRE